jgi:hypothetical protein
MARYDIEFRMNADGTPNQHQIWLDKPNGVYMSLTSDGFRLFQEEAGRSKPVSQSLVGPGGKYAAHAGLVQFVLDNRDHLDDFTVKPPEEDGADEDPNDGIQDAEWRESGDDTDNPPDPGSPRPQGKEEFQPLDTPQGEPQDQGFFKGILSGFLDGVSLALQRAKRTAGASVQPSESETTTDGRHRRRPEAIQRRRQTVRRPRRTARQHEPTAWEWAEQHEAEQSDSNTSHPVLAFIASKLLTVVFFAAIAMCIYLAFRAIEAPYLSATWWAVLAFGLCMLLWAVGSLVVSVYKSGNSS